MPIRLIAHWAFVGWLFACSSSTKDQPGGNADLGGQGGGTQQTGGGNNPSLGGSSSRGGSHSSSGGGVENPSAGSSARAGSANASGGRSDAGGPAVLGGSVATGGVHSTAGAGVSGSSHAAGSGAYAGESLAAGGASAESGGAVAVGGSKASGGASATGGSKATAGMSATGGTGASAGASATGGSKATAGMSATGGTGASAGASATGGSKATAGTSATGGTSGGTTATPQGGVGVILYGSPYTNVNMWYGPVDFAESEFHNACGLEDGTIYPAVIQNLYGDYLIGLDGVNIPNVESHCDNCAQLTANGNTIIAHVVTYGIENGVNAIDLSPQAQSALGLSSSNWKGTWQFCSCPTGGTPIYYEFDSRQWSPENFWYMRIWTRNQRLPVTLLETKIGSGSWVAASQESDGAWQTQSGVDFSGGFQVRVTAVDNQQLVDTIPAPTGLDPTQPVAGQTNFP
jgi:hypothetical protein